MALTHCGHVGRAAKALLQAQLPVVTGRVVGQLRGLHPAASGAIPPLPTTSPTVAVDPEILQKLIKSKLCNGSATGPSGWTGELVSALVGDADCMRGLCLLVQDILNGHLDAVSRSFLLASLLIPVGKANGGVRPVAVSECFYKLATMYALASVRHTFPSLFEPIQLGVGSPGGPEHAVHVLYAAWSYSVTSRL